MRRLTAESCKTSRDCFSGTSLWPLVWPRLCPWRHRGRTSVRLHILLCNCSDISGISVRTSQKAGDCSHSHLCFHGLLTKGLAALPVCPGGTWAPGDRSDGASHVRGFGSAVTAHLAWQVCRCLISQSPHMLNMCFPEQLAEPMCPFPAFVFAEGEKEAKFARLLMLLRLSFE